MKSNVERNLDDVSCGWVVDRGREYTGFRRLSLWFIDPGDTDWLIGSYGIDGIEIL